MMDKTMGLYFMGQSLFSQDVLQHWPVARQYVNDTTFLLLNGPPTSKCEHVSTSLSPAFTVLFKRYWAHTVFVTRWNKRILRFVSAVCGNCNWWNQRDQKACLFGQCETTDENDGVLWNPFNFFILETSRPFGIPNWRFNFDSFIDRPFPSHIVFGFIPPKPGARAGHFVKGQSAAIGHGAVTSKTTTVSAVISDNQTIQNKFGHLMYIYMCFTDAFDFKKKIAIVEFIMYITV